MASYNLNRQIGIYTKKLVLLFFIALRLPTLKQLVNLMYINVIHEDVRLNDIRVGKEIGKAYCFQGSFDHDVAQRVEAVSYPVDRLKIFRFLGIGLDLFSQSL